jgi:tetratricopeptide (TPR) repeat protein
VPVSSAEQHAPAPRLQPSDFALPNERIEPREEVRFAYIEAIALAREGKSAAAAQKLRLFARTYPSSPLAPRAIFLAALLSEDPQVAEQDVRTLQRFFPTSDYLTELKLRGLSVADDVPAKSAQLASSTWETSSSAPIRQLNQVRDRVEELMRDKRYVEALSVLEQIPNGQGIPDVLDLQAQCYLGLGDNRTALAMIAQLLENFPSYERRQAIRLSYGLLLEDASQYERARAEYRKILEEAPDSDEARAARARLEQLNTLTE